MGIMCVFEELREKELIDPNRDYPIPIKNQRNFVASHGKIKFDPEIAKLFNDDLLRCTLLHEENHLQNVKKNEKLLEFDFFIGFFFWFPFIAFILILTNLEIENIILILGMIIYTILIFSLNYIFIGPLMLQGRYYELEFNADYYAATTINKEYPGREPHIILNNVFETMRNYKDNQLNSASFWKKIKWGIIKVRDKNTHPSRIERIERIRLLDK